MAKSRKAMSGRRVRKFGTQVRSLREQQEIGLRELAEIVGMSPAYLSMVERNELAPPAEEKVVSIAEALDQDSDQFLALAGRISSDLPEVITKNPTEMAALVRATRGLTPPKIEALTQQARKLKGRR
ncbi:MAG: helix-turn-helix domain-containing protein [Planctomycetota bacterium]